MKKFLIFSLLIGCASADERKQIPADEVSFYPYQGKTIRDIQSLNDGTTLLIHFVDGKRLHLKSYKYSIKVIQE